MSEFKIPTEMVDLPSKGLFYPIDHPLKEGKLEIKQSKAFAPLYVRGKVQSETDKE